MTETIDILEVGREEKLVCRNTLITSTRLLRKGTTRTAHVRAMQLQTALHIAGVEVCPAASDVIPKGSGQSQFCCQRRSRRPRQVSTCTNVEDRVSMFLKNVDPSLVWRLCKKMISEVAPQTGESRDRFVSQFTMIRFTAGDVFIYSLTSSLQCQSWMLVSCCVDAENELLFSARARLFSLTFVCLIPSRHVVSAIWNNQWTFVLPGEIPCTYPYLQLMRFTTV